MLHARFPPPSRSTLLLGQHPLPACSTRLSSRAWQQVPSWPPPANRPQFFVFPAASGPLQVSSSGEKQTNKQKQDQTNSSNTEKNKTKAEQQPQRAATSHRAGLQKANVQTAPDLAAGAAHGGTPCAHFGENKRCLSHQATLTWAWR